MIIYKYKKTTDKMNDLRNKKLSHLFLYFHLQLKHDARMERTSFNLKPSCAGIFHFKTDCSVEPVLYNNLTW